MCSSDLTPLPGSSNLHLGIMADSLFAWVEVLPEKSRQKKHPTFKSVFFICSYKVSRTFWLRDFFNMDLMADDLGALIITAFYQYFIPLIGRKVSFIVFMDGSIQRLIGNNRYALI